MPQLAIMLPGKMLLLGGCCVGAAVLVLLALSLVIAILKKGEAKDPSKPK
ncbi:MAG: hypothetical protein NT049_00355 [Planctomycetota bacterium]|nr:hypothetical protein [Planctomycetota bacterium]